MSCFPRANLDLLNEFETTARSRGEEAIDYRFVLIRFDTASAVDEPTIGNHKLGGPVQHAFLENNELRSLFRVQTPLNIRLFLQDTGVATWGIQIDPFKLSSFRLSISNRSPAKGRALEIPIRFKLDSSRLKRGPGKSTDTISSSPSPKRVLKRIVFPPEQRTGQEFVPRKIRSATPLARFGSRDPECKQLLLQTDALLAASQTD